MIKSKNILISISLSIGLIACIKTEEFLVEGNVAPPDETIENVTFENYVNKLYISLLGRKATDQEYSYGLNTIESEDLSETSRETLISSIQSLSDYNVNQFEIARASLLEGLDTNTIQQYIYIFNDQLSNETDPDNIAIYNAEILKLQNLMDITGDLTDGSITMKDVHQRCVYNFFYDEVNMGTENLIVSIYQNFFYRYPTIEELEEATKVVEGLQGIVFYEVASGKANFISLFTESNEYYEGQVRELYLRYLFREPAASEMAHLANQYMDGATYQFIQQQILSSDEYVGL
jgi:hypothetical protein